MAETRDRGSVLATEEGSQLLKEAKSAKRNHNGKTLTYVDIEIESGVASKTIGRFFNREQPIDESKARAICQALGIEFNDVVEIRSGANVTKAEGYKIDWKKICRDMLDRQIQSPTLNYLMANDGISIDPVNLFVPVGLVERKQKQYRRSDIDSAEQGSQLLQPIEEEIAQRFDHLEQFFSQVICSPEISESSRLVITGEPGAGKTTLLQEIGDRLLKQGLFPIWISLGKEGVSPTEDLFNRILKKNAQPQDASSSNWDTSINALIQTGKVWLLLDGVDELTIGGYPLQIIGEQLEQRWGSQVNVVMTCRLNAWDTDTLPRFKVFRTLEFDYQTPVEEYANRVEAYIYKFFKQDEVDLQLANALIQQLYTTGKERIRDSAKNPLRLLLLCYVWKSCEGELPDTRAELYRLFIDYYYEIQGRKHPEREKISRLERDALNLALGKVAKAVLDSDNSRFRLKNSLIESITEMGKSDTKNSLFGKAIELGWLNRIGTTAEKSHEAAYAFFHPTFQEYFAALAIDDWNFFFPSEHENEPVKSKSYRVFEPQWKETFLLWVNCHEKKLSREQRRQIILELTDFNDGCGKWENLEGVNKGFYQFRASFLAFEVICSMSDSNQIPLVDNVINQVIELGFGYYFDRNQQAYAYWEPISQAARSILQNSDHEKVLEIVLKIFQPHQDKSILSQAAQVLKKIGIDKPTAIDRLLEIAQGNNKDVYSQSSAIATLSEISRGWQKVIDTFLFLLEDSTRDNYFKRLVASSLGEITQDKKDSISRQRAIYELETLCSSQNEEVNKLSAESLLKIDGSNQIAIQALEQLCDSLDENIQFESASILTDFYSLNLKAIQTLERLSLQSKNELTRLLSASVLKRIDEKGLIANQVYLELKDNAQDNIVRKSINRLEINEKDYPLLVSKIVNAICHAQNSSDILDFADHLKTILQSPFQESNVVKMLKVYINNEVYENDFLKFYACYDVVWHCAQNMSYPEFYRAWHSFSSANADLPTNDCETKP